MIAPATLKNQLSNNPSELSQNCDIVCIYDFSKVFDINYKQRIKSCGAVINDFEIP